MSLEIETETLDHSAKQQSEAYFQINNEAGLKDKSFKWFSKSLYSNIMKDLCKDFQHIMYERRYISKPEEFTAEKKIQKQNLEVLSRLLLSWKSIEAVISAKRTIAKF